MKRIHALLILTLIMLSTHVSLHAQQLTIEQCQQMAIEHYPAIAQFELIEKSKKFDIRNANTAFLPHLTLSTQATWQSDVTKIDLDMMGVDIPTIDKDQYNVVAEVNQLIWDAGIIGVQKKLIEAESEVQKQKLHSDVYMLRERINNLFFGILLLDERIELQQLMSNELKRNLDKVQTYVDNGVANEADLSSVMVEQLKLKQEQAELQATRKGYLKMLSLFIGKEIDNKNQLIKPNIDQYIADVSIRRPELQLFAAQQHLLNSQKKMLNANILPRIGAFVKGGYGRPGLNMFQNSFKPYFAGGIQLSWNFGNLYTHANDKRKIDIQQSMLDSNRETFLHNTNMIIPQQQIEIEKYRQKMQDDDEIIRLREVIRKSAEAKLDNGTITVSDMLKEVTAEDTARQAKVLHGIQYLMSIYNLKYTTN